MGKVMNRENVMLVLEKVSLAAKQMSPVLSYDEAENSILALIKLGTRENLTDISDHHLPVVLRIIDEFSKSPAAVKLSDEACGYCGCDPCDCDWGYDDYIDEFGEHGFQELVNTPPKDEVEDD